MWKKREDELAGEATTQGDWEGQDAGDGEDSEEDQEDEDWKGDEVDEDGSFDDESDSGDEDDEDDEDDGSELSSEGKLERVLSRLSFAIPEDCTIDVAPRSDINGWTDGETVTVTSGAVEELPEGALAALVAHELAHVHMRHVQHNRALAEGVGLLVAGVWRGSGSGLAGRLVRTVAAAGVSLVSVRLYQKFQELGADAGALYLLQKAGYTANDARELEQRLEGEGGLLATHPSQATRLRLLDVLDDE